jgi:Alw26I/Eco31I/Esp3I family type II restriction m6 adenine DNA methyltransferase
MTLLNDQQSKSLRKRILENYSISKIYTIAEKNDFFPDISQAFTFFVVDKANKTDSIEIVSDVNNYEELNKQGHFINYDTIKDISESNPIIIENETGINILKKISHNKKIREFKSILNLRGELDLTFHKDFITEKKTSLSLIKGANIKEFDIQGVNLCVNEDFLKKMGSKGNHTENRRIACQQISNIKSKKRLKFALVEKKFILGNSCNYIVIGNDLFGTEKSISLEYLLGLLNSDLMDWRFKLTNSNNHVSNYEISELPIIIPTQQQKNDIEKIVNQILLTKPQQRIQLINSLNTLVYNLYGLSKEEVAYISK